MPMVTGMAGSAKSHAIFSPIVWLCLAASMVAIATSATSKMSGAMAGARLFLRLHSITMMAMTARIMGAKSGADFRTRIGKKRCGGYL